MSKMHIKLTVNGKQEELLAEPRELLIHVLRERLSITGPHIGCETSHCGACTVDMNGKSVKSCTVLAAQANGAEITTIEGLGTPEAPHPVQQAFVDHAGGQCGYCLNGMIIAVAGLLNRSAVPSEADIREALRHHLCRCGAHVEILAAARAAAGLTRGEPA